MLLDEKGKKPITKLVDIDDVEILSDTCYNLMHNFCCDLLTEKGIVTEEMSLEDTKAIFKDYMNYMKYYLCIDMWTREVKIKK